MREGEPSRFHGDFMIPESVSVVAPLLLALFVAVFVFKVAVRWMVVLFSLGFLGWLAVYWLSL